MILINKTIELKKFRSFINGLFTKYGQTHFHHYYGIESALIQNKHNDFYVAIDIKNSIVSAFGRKSSDTWECFFKGFPLLTTNNIDQNKIEGFVKEIKSILGANTLYFPLVYRTSRILSTFQNKDQFYIYERLSNQIIKPPFDQEEIWKRVRKRYGSRADKQKSKFEKDLHTKTFSGNDVKDMISNVESNSWKRIYKQDMFSRDNQIDYYNNLVKSGLAEIVFACNKTDLPVAFMINVEINKILYVLKWSYDDHFKKYSPGFYLLTVDLPRRYGDTKYKYIDLYGSLDSLKALVKTDEIKRVDVIFSDHRKEVKQFSRGKIAYDSRVRNNYEKNFGIKNLFNLD